jgi:hypothetical protein
MYIAFDVVVTDGTRDETAVVSTVMKIMLNLLYAELGTQIGVRLEGLTRMSCDLRCSHAVRPSTVVESSISRELAPLIPAFQVEHCFGFHGSTTNPFS